MHNEKIEHALVDFLGAATQPLCQSGSAPDVTLRFGVGRVLDKWGVGEFVRGC